MLYMVRFDITQPDAMSTDRLYEIWNGEAKAALEAKAAGAVVDLWKVAGQRTVFALCDFPDHTSLDRALSGLPIVVALGSNAKTQAWPVYPYEEYADQLREAVEGS
jgi:muconolactone D-isomerase